MDIKISQDTVIVFDLDDTLYNELDYLKSAYQHIAQQLDQKDWKQLYTSMLSLYRCKENVFEVLVSKYGVEQKTLVDMYRYHLPNINLFDGILNIINNIISKNGKLGIITDGRTKTQIAKLKALGVFDLFDKIIISEDLGTEKPDEANYKAIESAIKGTEYWYIADNLKKDFVSPNRLGWKSIGLIDNGKNIHYQANQYMSEAHQPKHFILSYNELNII